MADQPGNPILKQPFIILLTGHWVSMLGVALVTLAGFSWLFVLPANIRGHVDNPYIGLLAFVAIPAIFLLGLILIPIGMGLAKRHLAETLAVIPDRRAAWRRAGIFFLVMSGVNVVIASQASYRAVEHMETVQFCGQSCHVMKPEFTAHELPAAHQNVACASCHIAPGATGWLKAKMAGTNQLLAVIANTYPRPIESALENNKLVSSAETCEQCHTRERSGGPRLRILAKFTDDEANTRTISVLLLQVGRIHAVHMGPGVHIRYRAADKKRQTVPWVEYRNNDAARTYVAGDARQEAVASLPVFEMQCADCHNRASHSFETPERAVDGAISAGQIPADLPFVKKTGVELIKASYSSQEEASAKVSAGLTDFYRQRYAQLLSSRGNDVQQAARALAAVYGHNVFPDLKVTWGTYPNNLGHMDYPGCFRCHDDSHATTDKKTITQDCGACHGLLAMDEKSPEILKSLGIATGR